MKRFYDDFKIMTANKQIVMQFVIYKNTMKVKMKKKNIAFLLSVCDNFTFQRRTFRA